MHKVLLFGSTGLLGSQFAKLLSESNKFELLAPLSSQVDLRSFQQLSDYISEHKPDYIINCTGYNLVDKCESDDAQQQQALELNVTAVESLAKLAAQDSIRFITFSSDYVFNGSKNSAYLESDAVEAINFYGKTKAMAEQAALNANPETLIIRTSWLFGPNKRDFIDAISNKLTTDANPVPVVDDQVGCPTYTVDLAARVVEEYIDSSLSGIVHLTNDGSCSWYEYACLIQELLGTRANILPVDSSGFQTLATRPKYSIMRSERIEPLRDYKLAVKEYLLNT